MERNVGRASCPPYILVGDGQLTLRCRVNEGCVTAFAGHAHAWITHAKVAKDGKDGLRREGSTGMMPPSWGMVRRLECGKVFLQQTWRPLRTLRDFIFAHAKGEEGLDRERGEVRLKA